MKVPFGTVSKGHTLSFILFSFELVFDANVFIKIKKHIKKRTMNDIYNIDSMTISMLLKRELLQTNFFKKL